MLYSLLLALALGVCHAVPTESVLHETRGDAPGWKKLGRIPKDAVLPMRVGLSQSNLDMGHELLQNISDPESLHYGKHYTQAQVIDLFKPSLETVLAVKIWLNEHVDGDRITHSDNKGWFAFDATAEEAEKLLSTKFYGFRHEKTGRITPASDAYYIPKHLVGHIDYVTPGVRLLSPEKRRVESSEFKSDLDKTTPSWNMPSSLDKDQRPRNDTESLKHCDTAITDACIRALYQVPLPQALYGGTTPQPNNALGIFEFGDTYLQQNLNEYFENYTPWIPRGTHPTFESVDGGYKPKRKTDSGESDLDFILAYPLIYPQEIKLFQTGGLAYIESFEYGDGLFNTFLDAIDGSYCTYKAFGEKGNDPKVDPHYPRKGHYKRKGKLQCGVYEPTPVISISYGMQEADLPIYYQKRQCNEFMKLALQGVSVLIASGDAGVAGREGCLGDSGRVFNPTYPANCPWVTAVGATKVPKGRTVFDPEVAPYDPALNHYSSSGGFSNIYSTPAYQSAAVETYLTQHRPPYKSYESPKSMGKGVYHCGGRGIPDVAANGDNDVVYTRGERVKSAGTSAAAPIFASIINRINEERLAAGKATVGFLNTALYKNAWMLNDITEGSNPGCGTKGFYAKDGWDPVTGLGTPNYDRMLAYFMSLP